MVTELKSHREAILWDVSVHEAGHAVLTHVLGGNIRELYVCPNGTWNGYCWIEFDVDLKDKYTLRGWFISMWGGYWAMRHINRISERFASDHSTADRVMMHNMARLHVVPEDYTDQWYHVADRLVRRHRRLIQRVAAALRDCATREDVIALMDRACVN